ncbi:MAG: hypothetical protein P4L68_10835 [Methylovirgula sp.]|nr:hypothetical protein [Methylovirgula sp.]
MDSAIRELAEAIWGQLVPGGSSNLDLALRAKLAIETNLLGRTTIPFGLDRLTDREAAAYLGCRAEMLNDRHRRWRHKIPEPYVIARQKFWRRSELDAWIEAQRQTGASDEN